MLHLLWVVAVVLIVFWLLGLMFRIAGKVIHLLLVVLSFTSPISFAYPSLSTPPFKSSPKSSWAGYPQTRSHEDIYKGLSPFSRVPGYHAPIDRRGYS